MGVAYHELYGRAPLERGEFFILAATATDFTNVLEYRKGWGEFSKQNILKKPTERFDSGFF